MENLLNYWKANKVFIIGLILSALMGIQQMIKTGPVDHTALIYAAFLAGLTYWAKSKRGQTTTIVTAILPSLAVLYEGYQGGNLNYWETLLPIVISYLGAVAPDAKPVGYEHAPQIEGAKEIGKYVNNQSTSVL